MSSVLCSHSLIVAAAMAASGAVILLSLRRHKSPLQVLWEHNRDSKQTPRSCLSSGDKEKKTKRKKKRVRFADDVKVNDDSTPPSLRRRHDLDHHHHHHQHQQHHHHRGRKPTREMMDQKPCREEEISVPAAVKRRMPSNREALYRGILRDRVHIHRMQCSY